MLAHLDAEPCSLHNCNTYFLCMYMCKCMYVDYNEEDFWLQQKWMHK